MTTRLYSVFDTVIIECDKAVKTIFGKPEITGRPVPGAEMKNNELTKPEQLLSTRLMRVNHSGEVSAQALYQGQALTAKLPEIRQAMEHAAIEENDHLLWCEQRVHHFGGHVSILNPLWYAGSFAMGAVAGKIGDKWSLGFVAETEKQVVKHLDEHLEQISTEDHKSKAILEQMKVDELHHGTMALEAGGVELPLPVKAVMGLMSKVMTKTSYWL